MTELMTKRQWNGTPRWVKWLLGVSLVLNFVVIGLAIGAAARFHKHGHSHGGVATIGHIMRALPHDRKDEARELLRAARPEFKPLRAERKAAQIAVADAIEQAPFDRSAVLKAFDELRLKGERTKASAHGVMVDVLAVLSPEERTEVAASLRKRAERSK